MITLKEVDKGNLTVGIKYRVEWKSGKSTGSFTSYLRMVEKDKGNPQDLTKATFVFYPDIHVRCPNIKFLI